MRNSPKEVGDAREKPCPAARVAGRPSNARGRVRRTRSARAESRIDHLTQLPNRRALKERMGEFTCCFRAKRKAWALSRSSCLTWITSSLLTIRTGMLPATPCSAPSAKRRAKFRRASDFLSRRRGRVRCPASRFGVTALPVRRGTVSPGNRHDQAQNRRPEANRHRQLWRSHGSDAGNVPPTTSAGR